MLKTRGRFSVLAKHAVNRRACLAAWAAAMCLSAVAFAIFLGGGPFQFVSQSLSIPASQDLVNGAFEFGISGWRTVGGRSAYVSTKTVPNMGGVLCVSVSGDGQPMNELYLFGAFQDIAIPDCGARSVRIAASAIGGSGISPQVLIEFIDLSFSDPRPGEGQALQDRIQFPDDGDWHSIARSIRVPESSLFLRITCRLSPSEGGPSTSLDPESVVCFDNVAVSWM